MKRNIAAFKSLTGATLPVMNAPMAGVTTPEMVAAVSNAGGLGVLAADFLEAGEITSAVAAPCALKRTNRLPSIYGFPQWLKGAIARPL